MPPGQRLRPTNWRHRPASAISIADFARCAGQGRLVDRFPALAGFCVASVAETYGSERVPVRIVHPDPGLRVVLEPETPVRADWYQFELCFPPEGLVDVQIELSFADSRVLWLRMPVLARNHFFAHFRLEDALERLTLIVIGSGRLTEPMVCRF